MPSVVLDAKDVVMDKHTQTVLVDSVPNEWEKHILKR